jgi:uncharacterized protein
MTSEPVSLPDVNVLVALAWPNHVHHRAASDWFRRTGARAWASCPWTQSGFVRVSCNPRAIPDARLPQEAIALLQRFTALPGHRFWSDEIALVDSPAVARDKLIGYRQITDAHLLALAIVHGGRLATFDRGVTALVPAGQRANEPVEVLRA